MKQRSFPQPPLTPPPPLFPSFERGRDHKVNFQCLFKPPIVWLLWFLRACDCLRPCDWFIYVWLPRGNISSRLYGAWVKGKWDQVFGNKHHQLHDWIISFAAILWVHICVKWVSRWHFENTLPHSTERRVCAFSPHDWVTTLIPDKTWPWLTDLRTKTHNVPIMSATDGLKATALDTHTHTHGEIYFWT